MKKYILLFVLAVLTFRTAISQTPYKKAIDSVLKAHKVIGLAYTVVSAEKEIESAIWGVRQIATSDFIQLSDRFHIGSNAKAFTAFLAARMVESGKITWDTKFFDIFPDLKAAAKENYYNITIKDLLSHRAYLQAFRAGEDYTKIVSTDSSARGQRIAFAKYALTLDPVKFPQGQSYSYSNGGYILAAAMLEKITDTSWEQQAIQLFNLEMGLGIDFGFPNRLNRKQPWGHLSEGNKRIATAPDHAYRLPSASIPAGDMNTTIQEYGKWLRHYLLGLQGKDTYLKEETYKFMLFGLPEYSMGWANIIKGDKIHYAMHEGSAGTFFSHAGISQEKNIAVAIFSNSADPQTVAAITEVSRILMKNFAK
jgi:CubicO group peptidase (beta-lactamase class C family)